MKTRLAIVLIALMAFACAESPKSDNAEVADAKEVNKVEEAVSYTVSDESHVTWIGTKLNGQHNGTIAISEGAIEVKEGDIVGANITIDLNQIDVLDLEGEYEDKLVGHLQSPDFFMTDSFPTATFELTSVAAYTADSTTTEGDDESDLKVQDPTHTLTGNLTMRGTTKSISFPAKVSTEGDAVTAVANFNIDRTQWGVSYNADSGVGDIAKDKVINNTVNVGFNLTATKPAPATETAPATSAE